MVGENILSCALVLYIIYTECMLKLSNCDVNAGCHSLVHENRTRFAEDDMVIFLEY